MKYTFGVLNNGEPFVRIKAESPCVLSSYQSFVTEYDDAVITDEFTIERLIESKEDNGFYYYWYKIKDHTRTIDKAIKIAMQNRANIDYIAMMADIDIDRSDYGA